MQPPRVLQQLARPRTIRRPDQSVPLHQIDQVRSPAVADAQPPLQQGSRSLAKLEDQSYRVVEQLVIVALGRPVAFHLLALFARSLEEAFDVLGLALRLPE